jgi:hypothetical protein
VSSAAGESAEDTLAKEVPLEERNMEVDAEEGREQRSANGDKRECTSLRSTGVLSKSEDDDLRRPLRSYPPVAIEGATISYFPRSTICEAMGVSKLIRRPFTM